MIILASNSPRRRELLSFTGWEFTIRPADVDETPQSGEIPLNYVRRIADEKACAIQGAGNEDIILSADTIVVDGNEILEKPVSAMDAYRMLRQLRGRTHVVHTALTIRTAGSNLTHRDLCSSSVKMRNYTDREIEEYIRSGDPMDKAGAYAVQNVTFHPVINFQGCFANVMGLPLCHLIRTMVKYIPIQKTTVERACLEKLKYDCSIHAKVLNWLDLG